ncbi:MAG TPA: tripartite tricarboxylate transporter substrate-binding protein, partial [Burkholderiales bacterium]|nr:tripartite tricarboxylate transporter substrate-binding protein [Burkholderiales bacterium]
MTFIAAALLAIGTAAAQQPAGAFPVKPVRLITPFSAGGGTDIIARLIAQKLGEEWSQAVIVDNRGGGNGNIGTDLVVRAAPDGYTVLLTTNAPIVINPHMTKVPYDPQKDLAPVSLIARVPFVLVTHPSLPAKSVPELIALAKAKPGKLNYGSSGS